MSKTEFGWFRRWWHGKTIVANLDEFRKPGGKAVFIGPSPTWQHYHWTARYARAIVSFYRAQWVGLWGVAGVIIGLIALFK